MKALRLIFCFTVFALNFSFCEGQSWVWGAMGSTTSDTYAVASDRTGNAYLAGYFNDSISFGSNHLTSLWTDSYLVKYDSVGNLIWVAQSKVTSSHGKASTIYIATDNYGNTFATGWFKDTVTFGSDSIKFTSIDINRYSDVFTVKYDVNGTPIWAEQANIPYTSGVGAYSNSIATDKGGNTLVTGYFGDIAIFGSDTLETMYSNSFLVKYDTYGNVLWARQSNDIVSSNPPTADGTSVAVDNLGNIYMVGQFQRTVAFETDTLNSTRLSTFLVKYDSNGYVLWAKQADASRSYFLQVYSVAVDQNGNSYITGYFQDTLIFGLDTLGANLNGSIFLVKYDRLGDVLWSKCSTTDSGGGTGYSLSIDSLDLVYFSTRVSGKIIFDKDTFKNSSGDGSVIMKIDTSGDITCAETINCGGDDNNTIAVDPSGRYIYWGGDIAESHIFGKDTLLIGSSVEPPFVARWQPCDKSSEGINEINSSEYSISLFPNPNSGKFTISCNSKSPNKIEIYNVLGEKVDEETLRGTQGDKVINLSGQPNGVYLYGVISENGTVAGEGKFVIAK